MLVPEMLKNVEVGLGHPADNDREAFGKKQEQASEHDQAVALRKDQIHHDFMNWRG